MKIFLTMIVLLSSLYADRDGGPYLGLGYGEYTSKDSNPSASKSENASSFINAYAGAYINKHLSVELSYLRDYESNDASMEFTALSVSTLAHYPFYDDMFDIYAKFGASNIGIKNFEDDGFGFIYGAGFGYRLSDLIGFKIAYDRYDFKYKESLDVSHGMTVDCVYGAMEFQF